MNNCTPHRPDSVSATAAYQGRNARGVNINSDNTCQDGTDNVSEIGFGNIPTAESPTHASGAGGA